MNNNKRPKTLTEVVRRINNGGKLSYALAEFIDEVLKMKDPEGLLAMIEKDPGLIDPEADYFESFQNAYIGGIAEHIARINDIEIPYWVNDKSRMLKKAWFANAGLKSLNAMLIAESPLAFRRRFIFAEKNPLNRI